jgi:hypothetical protein
MRAVAVVGAFWFSVAACGWSAALVAGAFIVPMYSSSATWASGVHIAESITLVQVNGLLVLIPVGVPLLIALMVWTALHRKCSRGSDAAGAVLVTVLSLGCLIGLASIGVLVIPVALLLGCAVAITSSGDSSRGCQTLVTG